MYLVLHEARTVVNGDAVYCLQPPPKEHFAVLLSSANSELFCGRITPRCTAVHDGQKLNVARQRLIWITCACRTYRGRLSVLLLFMHTQASFESDSYTGIVMFCGHPRTSAAYTSKVRPTRSLPTQLNTADECCHMPKLDCCCCTGEGAIAARYTGDYST